MNMQKLTGFNMLIYACAACVALLTLLPIIWVLLTSFKNEAEIFSLASKIIPGSLYLENYAKTLLKSDYGYYAVNSLVVGCASTCLVMLLSILSGYSYSKFFTFTGKNALMVFIIICRMVPEIAVIIPLFMLIQSIGLYDSKMGLVLVYAATAYPLATWLIKTFFDELPTSIVESATIDGCGPLGTLWRIILPVSGPSLASTVTITFLTVWNPFLTALVLGKTIRSKTLPVAISELAYAEYGVNWGGLSAIAIVTVIPVFLIGLLAQKYLTTGLTAGAVKY